jgi:PAS domain S-box-containing protein
MDNEPAEKKEELNPSISLRKRAEKQISSSEAWTSEVLSPEETKRLLHELQVHQIELEMQNEELRRTQEELEVSRARYFDLYDLAPVGYLTVSEKGLIQEANIATASLLGVERSALVNQPLSRFILPEDQDNYYRHRKKIFETGVSQSFDIRFLCAGSAPFWARVDATVEPNVAGVLEFSAVVIDISELKRADEEHRRQADLLRLSYDVVIVWRLGGNIESWNRGAEHLYGFIEKEALGKITHNLLATVHPEPWEQIEYALREKGLWEGELRHYTKDGREIVVSARKQLIRGDDGVDRVLEINRDITERKKAEEALRESERNLSTVFRASPTGIFVTRLSDGLFVDANESYLEIMGYSIDEVIGHSSLELNIWTTPEDWEIMANILRERGRIVNKETKLRRKSGEFVHLIYSALPLEREGEQCILGTVIDISERKRIEEALHESRARLDLALHSSRMATFDWDIVNNKRSWSDGVHELLGTNPETFTGEAEEFFEVVHPEDRGTVKAALARAVEITGELETEYRAVRPDGSMRHIAARGKVNRNSEGQAVLLTGVCWDITEMKRAEEALKESEERFRNMFEHHKAVMLLVEPESGAIVDANMAAAAFYKRSQKELRAMNIRDINLLPQEEVTDELGKAVKGERSNFVFPHSIAGGEVRWVEVYSTPIEVHQKPMLFSVIHDITGRRQAEEQIQRHVEDLRANNDELERLNRAMVGRELRMVELKREVNEMCVREGEPPRYNVDFVEE